ncbi:MAG: FtsX-like permease family protein [Steroidobacteraceae bacterium]
MHLRPILVSLRRNKAGAVLAVVQIALTSAILANVLSIVAGRTVLITRPTGTQEHDLFALGYRLTRGVATMSTLEADLKVIRDRTGVADAIATNSYPLRAGGWLNSGVSLIPNALSASQQSAHTAVYEMDQHGVGTLGLKLVEGRNFAATEIEQGHLSNGPAPAVALLSKSLARQLFPHGPALGKLIYLTADPQKPISIIGVVERLQSPAAARTIDEHESENSIILPVVSSGPIGLFVIRAKPGTLDGTMRDVQNALFKVNPNRIFGKLRPFDEIRHTAYQKDRAIAIALSMISLILVAITVFAIVGLTSFWVLRRRPQIGLRRAMGATRPEIVRYFLIENALLCTAGVVLGAIASHGLSTWLWSRYGTDPLPVSEILISAVLVLALGQGAATLPALRAARTSPSDALRAL